MKPEHSSQIFEKYSDTKFQENPFNGSQVFFFRGRTDMHNGANIRCAQFCERIPRNVCYSAKRRDGFRILCSSLCNHYRILFHNSCRARNTKRTNHVSLAPVLRKRGYTYTLWHEQEQRRDGYVSQRLLLQTKGTGTLCIWINTQ
jgi:hypothetical protein